MRLLGGVGVFLNVFQPKMDEYFGDVLHVKKELLPQIRKKKKVKGRDGRAVLLWKVVFVVRSEF